MKTCRTALAALLATALLVCSANAQATSPSPPDASHSATDTSTLGSEAGVAPVVCRKVCNGHSRGDRVGRPYTPLHNFYDTSVALQVGQHARTFEGKLPNGRTAKLNYLLFLPASYGQEPDKKWPLLIFLHGSREVGRDINRVKRAILPQIVEENPEFPFIVVSPQAPSMQNGWYPSLKAIEALLDELQSSLSVDPDRIYLTGLSMGGYGAWALAMEDPDRFAAIAPVVGGYYYHPRQLCELKDKPIWVFGAKRDRNVPLRESERVVNALKACGANPKFTVFENANHDEGWELAYTTTEIFEWLLQQRRGQPPTQASN